MEKLLSPQFVFSLPSRFTTRHVSLW